MKSDEVLREKYGLTPRQIEIAKCIMTGLPNTKVAENLGITYYTMTTYMHEIFFKAKVKTKYKLILWMALDEN